MDWLGSAYIYTDYADLFLSSVEAFLAASNIISDFRLNLM